nr:12849_t:CDS:2 [Entrophospora candida]
MNNQSDNRSGYIDNDETEDLEICDMDLEKFFFLEDNDKIDEDMELESHKD